MSYEQRGMGQLPVALQPSCSQVPNGRLVWAPGMPRTGCVATGKTSPGTGRSMPELQWCCPPTKQEIANEQNMQAMLEIWEHAAQQNQWGVGLRRPVQIDVCPTNCSPVYDGGQVVDCECAPYGPVPGTTPAVVTQPTITAAPSGLAAVPWWAWVGGAGVLVLLLMKGGSKANSSRVRYEQLLSRGSGVKLYEASDELTGKYLGMVHKMGASWYAVPFGKSRLEQPFKTRSDAGEALLGSPA